MKIVSVGRGPDFILRRDNEEIYHRAKLLVYEYDRVAFSQTMSHKSLNSLSRELLKLIDLKLRIAPELQLQVEIIAQPMVQEISFTSGNMKWVVFYFFTANVTAKHQSNMTQFFVKKFKNIKPFSALSSY
jgi:hypothetical protein